MTTDRYNLPIRDKVSPIGESRRVEPQTEGVPGYVVSVATVLERVDESADDCAEAAP